MVFCINFFVFNSIHLLCPHPIRGIPSYHRILRQIHCLWQFSIHLAISWSIFWRFPHKFWIYRRLVCLSNGTTICFDNNDSFMSPTSCKGISMEIIIYQSQEYLAMLPSFLFVLLFVRNLELKIIKFCTFIDLFVNEWIYSRWVWIYQQWNLSTCDTKIP